MLGKRDFTRRVRTKETVPIERLRRDTTGQTRSRGVAHGKELRAERESYDKAGRKLPVKHNKRERGERGTGNQGKEKKRIDGQ